MEELKLMIAKYQDQNQDWQPIHDDMTIEQMEHRFDSETAKRLGIENIVVTE